MSPEGCTYQRRASTWLPRAPFAAWLERVVEQSGGPVLAAERLGIAQRNVLALRSHRSSVVRLHTVDRLFTAAGEPHMLVELYPCPGAAHERFCSCCDDQVTTSDDLRCPWCESVTAPLSGALRPGADSGRMA